MLFGDHDEKTECVKCGSVACVCAANAAALDAAPSRLDQALAAEDAEMFASACAVLYGWLTTPNTARRVRELSRGADGRWTCELSAGSFRYASTGTQESAGGAIRNALQAAVCL